MGHPALTRTSRRLPVACAGLRVVDSLMAKNRTRRNFLLTAPLAAAVTLPLTDKLFAAAQGGSPMAVPPAPFQVFTNQTIDGLIKSEQAAPGTKNLIDVAAMPLGLEMGSEEKKTAKEFEFHEHRDHFFLIVEGATRFELGGKPEGAHSIGPGQWHAPTSVGATSVSLKKGEMLVVPRMTPHKRITDDRVTFFIVHATTT
jgi:mannose-6-phosphate isomerase-like protein (cupin superfamily)